MTGPVSRRAVLATPSLAVAAHGAERAYTFTATALEAGVRTVLTWGISDRSTWLVTDPALARPNGRMHGVCRWTTH